MHNYIYIDMGAPTPPMGVTPFRRKIRFDCVVLCIWFTRPSATLKRESKAMSASCQVAVTVGRTNGRAVRRSGGRCLLLSCMDS